MARARTSPTYVDDTVSQYTINSTTGALSPKTPAAVTTGHNPWGIAVSGDSVYVADYNGVTAVSQYTIDSTTGALSPKAAVGTFGGNPVAIAVSPNGTSAYVVNFFTGTVSQYTIDSSTGSLSPKTPATVTAAAGPGPAGIAVSPDGKSVYVTNTSDNAVSQFTINSTTGALSPKTPPTVAAGGDPTGIVVAPVRTCPKFFVLCNAVFQVFSTTATIATNLLLAAPVGILVQRILGRRIVTIGRVPLGRHRVGRVTLRWNLRVRGQKLAPGRYLITLRALSASGNVIALTAPVKITIHPKKHGHG